MPLVEGRKEGRVPGQANDRLPSARVLIGTRDPEMGQPDPAAAVFTPLGGLVSSRASK